MAPNPNTRSIRDPEVDLDDTSLVRYYRLSPREDPLTFETLLIRNHEWEPIPLDDIRFFSRSSRTSTSTSTSTNGSSIQQEDEITYKIEQSSIREGAVPEDLPQPRRPRRYLFGDPDDFITTAAGGYGQYGDIDSSSSVFGSHSHISNSVAGDLEVTRHAPPSFCGVPSTQNPINTPAISRSSNSKVPKSKEKTLYYECPFVKANPHRYEGVFNACTNRPGITIDRRFREHLTTHHGRKFRCMRCYRKFKEENEESLYRQHMEQDKCKAIEDPMSMPEIFTKEQEEAFQNPRLKGNQFNGKPPTDKWLAYFDALFQNHGQRHLMPDTITPYYDYLTLTHSLSRFNTPQLSITPAPVNTSIGSSNSSWVKVPHPSLTDGESYRSNASVTTPLTADDPRRHDQRMLPPKVSNSSDEILGLGTFMGDIQPSNFFNEAMAIDD